MHRRMHGNERGLQLINSISRALSALIAMVTYMSQMQRTTEFRSSHSSKTTVVSYFDYRVTPDDSMGYL